MVVVDRQISAVAVELVCIIAYRLLPSADNIVDHDVEATLTTKGSLVLPLSL